MDTCKRLSRDIPGALVLNRELGDEDLFLEEGLSGADLFLAVTSDQELNILAAARAKEAGIARSLALSQNNAYIGLADRLGVDGVVSMKSNVVSSIVEYLRGGILTTLHSFFARGVKVLEFVVGEGSPLHGTSVRDLALPKGTLVIFLHRNGRLLDLEPLRGPFQRSIRRRGHHRLHGPGGNEFRALLQGRQRQDPGGPGGFRDAGLCIRLPRRIPGHRGRPCPQRHFPWFRHGLQVWRFPVGVHPDNDRIRDHGL